MQRPGDCPAQTREYGLYTIITRTTRGLAYESIIAGESQTKLKRSKIMAPESVELSIPFESLVDSVTKLHLRDKFRLWELLDEQMADAEEDAWDEDPAVQAEIREARDAYQAGDYVTIDEYIAPL
jgi:hypothetical protein